ncbi:MAG: MMPL family transporter, partial [Myxococcales bacterium]|nr:MMPL family transporter [Myxococcales bacterium]
MLERVLRRLTHVQARRPWVVLGLAAVVAVLAVLAAKRLEVEGGFEHLLPDGKASVSEYRRVVSRTDGVATLFIVLEVEGEPAPQALREASAALVEELRAVGEPWVGSARDGVHDAVAFLEPRAGLYLDADELEALHTDVLERWSYEVGKAGGMLLDDDAPPPPLDAESLRRRLGLDGAARAFPDGYYQSEDGRALAVMVRSKIAGSDAVRGREALARIHAAVERVDLTSYDPRIRVGYGGNLQSAVAEVGALHDDLTEVGLLGAALIAFVVMLFYLRVRTLVVMLVTLALGVVWTAGAAYLAVGTLSIGTSFVFTIVAGNGLNTSVIYMARYMELRRRGDAMEEGLFFAHRDTIIATGAACAASSASFASLMSTSFRGFRDLGKLGAIGLVLCWVATVLVLPALLALAERWSPIEVERTRGLRAKLEAGFGKPFAFLTERAPRVIALSGVALAVLGFVALSRHIARDPMEYDLGKLRNEASGRAEEARVSQLGLRLTHDIGSDGMAVLVDRVDQVAPLRETLHALRDAASPANKPFEAVIAIDDFLPEDQARKIPVLLEMAGILRKMHARGAIDESAWREVGRYLPPEDLAPITIADLPEAIARPFTENDGTRGRIVFIKPLASWTERMARPDAPEDGHYLLRWAASYRETTLPDGSVVLGSGRAVIYADMLEGVLEAVPTATLAAMLAVLLVALSAFRFRRATIYVLGSLLVGVGWMAAILVALDIKLNFLNFVALP